MILYFTCESRDTFKYFPLFLSVKTFPKLNLGQSVVVHVLWTTRIWSFHVVVLQKTAKKCTKNYNASAQPFFLLISLLFSDVPAAVVVCCFLFFLIPCWSRGFV